MFNRKTWLAAIVITAICVVGFTSFVTQQRVLAAAAIFALLLIFGLLLLAVIPRAAKLSRGLARRLDQMERNQSLELRRISNAAKSFSQANKGLYDKLELMDHDLSRISRDLSKVSQRVVHAERRLLSVTEEERHSSEQNAQKHLELLQRVHDSIDQLQWRFARYLLNENQHDVSLVERSESISQALADHHEAKRAIWRLIREVQTDSTVGKKERENALNELYGVLSDKDIKQFFVTDSTDYQIGTSFRSSMNSLLRLKHHMKLHGYEVAPRDNSKTKDREFAARFGIPVPQTLVSSIPPEALELIPNSILKPVRGSSSKGVFFVDSDLKLHSFWSGKSYATFSQAQGEIQQHVSAISENEWMVEEVILGADGQPANDLKVYTFYGVPGMFLEMKRQRPRGSTSGVLHYVSDSNREPMARGPNDRYFEGTPVPDEVIEKARILSLQSPVPFLRIDFHLGSEECYLGEITPQPGAIHAEEFYEEVDKKLGQMFADAQARLYIDLLNGKDFSTYFSVYDVTSPSRQLTNGDTFSDESVKREETDATPTSKTSKTEL